MRQEIRAGAELDILTAEELRTEIEGALSGYLRPPYRVRLEAGGKTDDSGNLTVDCLQARTGFQLLVNAVVIHPTGYDFKTTFNPGTAGAVELLRAGGPGGSQGELLRGYEFGGSTGGTLPAVYTSGDDRAIDLLDQEVLQVRILGGPADTIIVIHGHGTMIPKPDEAAY